MTMRLTSEHSQQCRCLAIVDVGLCNDAGRHGMGIELWRVLLFISDLSRINAVYYFIDRTIPQHRQRGE